jgi:hydroxyacyl-ACP dehydratase HTD2-like protein with hotdog domain
LSIATARQLPRRQRLAAAGQPCQTVAGRRASFSNALERSTKAVTADAVMLFRYSALTFNGHRIHYDADYCRQVEGYPGLVVHGPLIATLLLGLC